MATLSCISRIVGGLGSVKQTNQVGVASELFKGLGLEATSFPTESIEKLSP